MMETWINLAIVAVLGVLSLIFFIRSVIAIFQRQWSASLLRFVCAAAFLFLANMIIPAIITFAGSDLYFIFYDGRSDRETRKQLSKRFS